MTKDVNNVLRELIGRLVNLFTYEASLLEGKLRRTRDLVDTTRIVLDDHDRRMATEIEGAGNAFPASAPPRTPEPPPETTQSLSTPPPRGHYAPSDREAAMAARKLVTDVEFTDKGNTSAVVRKMLSSDGEINIYKPEAGADKDFESDTPARDSYAAREVAAYRLDEILGFGRIPPTARTEGVTGPEDRSGPGMIQQFVNSTPAEPIARYPVVQQQQVAVLDYIIGQEDRHPGNWRTVDRGDHLDLVAIDHTWSFHPSSDPFDVEIDSPFVAAHKGRLLEPDVLDAVRNVDTNHLRAAFEDAGLQPTSVEGTLARLGRVQELGHIPSDAKIVVH
jgi:hypothetical protein